MRSGLDETIHPINRLQICAQLSGVESLSFAAIRDGLGVSDSVLSKQLKVLQEAGYVTLRKEPFNSRIHAWVALTPLGRTVYTAHMAALREIAEGHAAHPPTGPH
ncbi:DNA-binding MarR family transcriptional regulator [Micromonospora luteifusca]|uniref:DNA-binding MarR family transcriptional regulator n=1 Tax=Micromonospora luteifusca TaxID=709860 RepID=A0ABS2M339_9ACTN|nr:transcriptional regulator [Micromonospora luteifusca]MBM7494851.1 DNA-binding MarR family transcriptional regulator [Micromonospora luteifusca]